MSPAPAVDERTSDDWGVLAERCPQLAATMGRYLAQQAVTLAPRTIEAADGALRRFGLWVSDYDPALTDAAELSRRHIEAFKIHCHTATNTRTAKPLATNTVRQRLRLLKVFFDRIIECGARRTRIVLGVDSCANAKSPPKSVSTVINTRSSARAAAIT